MDRRLPSLLLLVSVGVALTGCGAYDSYVSHTAEAAPVGRDIVAEHQEAIQIVHAVCDETPRIVPQPTGEAAHRTALREFLNVRRQEHGQTMLKARLELMQARAQIELYRLANSGESPSFQSVPWEIVTHGFLRSTPTNPLSPDTMARRVLVVETEGLDGSAVDPRRAGWVWNSTDRKLYLAGLTEDELCSASHAALHSAEPARVTPILASKLQSIREQLESYQYAHGSKPNLADEGWKPLTDRRLLSEIPLNPLSPYEAAALVVAGKNGMDVDPNRAGWVWDEGNQMLYAAGFDDRARLMFE
ncbi:MAG: hypothetical protein KC983_09705 [Phycisphaerales bacterium]|nr:hypothetical protein [Phycisphaerales bacterium]